MDLHDTALVESANPEDQPPTRAITINTTLRIGNLRLNPVAVCVMYVCGRREVERERKEKVNTKKKKKKSRFFIFTFFILIPFPPLTHLATFLHHPYGS